MQPSGSRHVKDAGGGSRKSDSKAIPRDKTSPPLGQGSQVQDSVETITATEAGLQSRRTRAGDCPSAVRKHALPKRPFPRLRCTHDVRWFEYPASPQATPPIPCRRNTPKRGIALKPPQACLHDFPFWIPHVPRLLKPVSFAAHASHLTICVVRLDPRR
jgi:hypothetical protein